VSAFEEGCCGGYVLDWVDYYAWAIDLSLDGAQYMNMAVMELQP